MVLLETKTKTHSMEKPPKTQWCSGFVSVSSSQFTFMVGVRKTELGNHNVGVL